MPTQTLPEGNLGFLDTYSKILGIQQAQQTLQTGKALQETAQAEAQIRANEAFQANQKQKEFQFLTIKGPQVLKDPNAFDENHIFRADYMIGQLAPGMPTSLAEVAPHFYEMQKSGIQVNQEAQKLNDEQRSAVYTTLSGMAMAQDFPQKINKASDYAEWIDNVREQLPKQAWPILDTVLKGVHTPPADRPYTADEKQHLQSGLEMLSRAALPPTAQQGPGGVGTPTAAPYQAPGGLGYMQTNINAPGGIRPTGPVVSQGIAPQVVASPVPGTPPAVLSNGGLHPLGGGMGGSAPGNVRGGPPAVGPKADPLAQFHMKPGEAASVQAQSEGITTRVQEAQRAANNTVPAQDALTRALAIMDNPNAPATGKGFDVKNWLANAASALGADTSAADDQNTLIKNIARYEASRATQAGLGGTDAARSLNHEGNARTDLDNAAMVKILRQSLAMEKSLATYANVQSKTTDYTQMLKNESDFRKIPRIIQGYEYQMSKSPQEAQAFLDKQGLSAAEMKKIRKQIKEFESR